MSTSRQGVVQYNTLQAVTEEVTKEAINGAVVYSHPNALTKHSATCVEPDAKQSTALRNIANNSAVTAAMKAVREERGVGVGSSVEG